MVDDHAGLEPVPGGAPLVLAHEPGLQVLEGAAFVEFAREMLHEHLHERGDGGELGQRRHAVARAHLDRAPARGGADVPAHFGRIVHHARAHHVVEVALVLRPVCERPREPRRRQLLEHQCAVRGVAGAVARPERARRRQGLQVRQIGRQSTDDRQHLVDVFDAHVHVDAPDHHVPAPPLRALDERVVAGLVGHLLVVPLRERVAARAQQLDVAGRGQCAHLRDRVADVVDGGRDRVADSARDLDRVGEQLAGDGVALELGALFELGQELGRAADEVAGVAVGQHELPLEPHGGAGRCREGHRHGVSLTRRTARTALGSRHPS